MKLKEKDVEVGFEQAVFALGCFWGASFWQDLATNMINTND